MRKSAGFTLIELMIVVSIIGILAAIALPGYQDYVIRAKTTEAILLAQPIQKSVGEYYERWGVLPADNTKAGLPTAQSMRGEYVESIAVMDGAIGIQFNQDSRIAGKYVYLRPAINKDYPTGALAWVCNASNVPEGFEVYGTLDLSKLPGKKYLPFSCKG